MHTLEQLQSGALTGTVRLQLSCGLREFPREIFELADSLEILDLSDNLLTSLPDDLPRLTRLRVIFCSNNPFTVLPAILGACPQLTMIGFKSCRIAEVPAAALPPTLRWLILTDNRVGALPPAIGRCSQLQKLMLAGNQLTALPPELASCTQLELLRIAANRITEVPDWLLAMPHLSWLAWAGNPLSADDEAQAAQAAHPPQIDWHRLQLARQLGEGASGVIYQAVMAASASAAPVPVAVKLFKGAITSDGLPRCELAACIGAGSHANLIPLLGQVSGHPDGVEGCVMALIDPAFGNLAGPPSLASCTRDIYPPSSRLGVSMLLRLVRGIASAAAHLHSRGIHHGDLYAHNILVTRDGDALLGDFGAASVYATQGPQAAALQRLEVRAFGVLLGELLERCDGDAGTALTQLQRDCMQAITAHRPAFDAICARLARVDDPAR